MKQLLSFALGSASVLAIVLLSSMSSTQESELPGGIMPGSSVFALNLQQGSGAGFSDMTAGTPVTIRELKDNWILIDYPGKSGGPSWVNLDAVISYQITR
ncbi:MAG: hypothetical protein ACI9F9_002422 [Candidatus Paceibacteria bacterium]|jgi:hypothetical protein